MKAQSSFSDRVARIENHTTFGASAGYRAQNLIQSRKVLRRIYGELLVAGGLLGGLAGLIFAQQFGLSTLLSMDMETLYELVMADRTMMGLLAGVAVGPIGFLLGQICGSPRVSQFWLGYFAGVLASNWSDIQIYAATLTAVG
ncbi:hypothetical protein [uncultured Tateyamaria sp.]|uniref:hypothetical protein n=1 Tax=uncultured Tateyamaria sp. TaxID=455651 RepID=UPI0026284409|nr:hypothetical protein [uncultured Tateyamaria sp.]